MVKEFYLVTWKQFENKFLLTRQEIVLTEDIEDSLNKLKTHNAEHRLTTTDYNTFNLTKLFKNNNLKVVEK